MITDWIINNNRIDDFESCYDQYTPPNPVAIGIPLVTENGMLNIFDEEEVEYDNVFKNSTCPAESHRVVVKATDP